MQGDHNATSVVFALDEALVNAAYQYRFEFVDGAGGYDTTDFVVLENSQASCLLPGNWTGAGSTGTIRLCAVILGADNTEEQVAYTLSGRLKFASRDTGTPMETEYEKGLSGLIADTKDAADAANQAAADAETAADAAQAVADTVQQKLDNGEFVGQPGDKGEKGDKGDKGDPGKDGVAVITKLSPGMFAFSVNAEGHLILTHNDNEPALRPFRYRTGNLSIQYLEEEGRRMAPGIDRFGKRYGSRKDRKGIRRYRPAGEHQHSDKYNRPAQRQRVRCMGPMYWRRRQGKYS